MTDTKIKSLNQPGDYYFCSLCAAWHRCTNDPSSTGNQHLSHLDENETNSPTSKYFFCSLCGKWHTDARKDHLRYRLYIQQDHNLNPMPSILPPNMLSSKPSKNPATAILSPFDGTADLWMTESENISRIRSAVARDHCKRIIDLIKGLDKNLHIQCFSKKNHLTFIMQGKNFAEIKPISGGFALSLKPNILNQGKRSVHKGEEEKFIFTGNGNPPISDDDITNRFIFEANNLIALRSQNTIGYHEKWLHCLLIEKMQNGGLPCADLEFLYYEAPTHKVKKENRKKYARMHVDILAKEHQSKALVIIEVKKENQVLNEVIGLDETLYVDYFVRFKDLIKPRIAQLGWDVDIDNLKFLIVAPDVDFKNSSLNMNIVENIKSLGCEVEALHLNDNWKETEDVYVVKTDKL